MRFFTTIKKAFFAGTLAFLFLCGVARADVGAPVGGAATTSEKETTASPNSPIHQDDTERLHQRWLLLGLMVAMLGVAGWYVNRGKEKNV